MSSPTPQTVSTSAAPAMPGLRSVTSTKAKVSPPAPPVSPAVPAPLPIKHTVAAKTLPLTAVPLTQPSAVTFADGRQATGQSGDFLITRGSLVIDLVGPTSFAERYSVIDERALTLDGSTRDRLEQVLGIGATRSPDHLLAAVDRLARIEIGGVRIDFTPGQLEEIARRAKKRAWSVEQAIKSVVDRIREDLFWRA